MSFSCKSWLCVGDTSANPFAFTVLLFGFLVLGVLWFSVSNALIKYKYIIYKYSMGSLKPSKSTAAHLVYLLSEEHLSPDEADIYLIKWFLPVVLLPKDLRLHIYLQQNSSQKGSTTHRLAFKWVGKTSIIKVLVKRRSPKMCVLPRIPLCCPEGRNQASGWEEMPTCGSDSPPSTQGSCWHWSQT